MGLNKLFTTKLRSMAPKPHRLHWSKTTTKNYTWEQCIAYITKRPTRQTHRKESVTIIKTPDIIKMNAKVSIIKHLTNTITKWKRIWNNKNNWLN